MGRWILATLFGLYLLSGFYIVGSDEIGVVRLFGRVWQSRVPPGLHYRPPFPMTRLDKVKVRQVRRVTLGIDAFDTLLRRPASPLQSEFLTGDQNILTIRAVIQYTVRDPVKFLFTAQNPEAVLQRVAESVLAEEVAKESVDDVLTAGKVAIQNRARKETQKILDSMYDLGVTLVRFNLERVAPPKEVKDAFDAVTEARQTRYRLVLEAQSYANMVVPKARGEAQRIINEAWAYYERRIAEAKAAAKKFEALLKEYRKVRGVTRTRLYIETLEEILPRLRKVVVDAKSGRIDLGMIRRESGGKER